MAKWNLKLNIAKEIKALKKLCEDLPETYEFEGETETKYMELASNLKNKFAEYEDQIKEVTEDDGTFEDLERNLEDLEMSIDIENSNFNMENIYEICDNAGILLEQLLEV